MLSTEHGDGSRPGRAGDADSGDGQLEAIITAVRRMQAQGAKLPSERQLAETLNVKRHQLRKALIALRAGGELRQPRERAQPAALPRFGEELVRLTNPVEVLELRLIMEPGLARLASIRASAVDIARVLDAATTPPQAEPGKADLAFHFAVMKAARNALAEEIYKTMRQVGYDSRIKIARGPSQTCPKRIARRDAEHRAVAEAIAARDPDAAEAAMRLHLISVQQQFNTLYSQGIQAS